MKAIEIKDILDGVAELEYIGDLFEYIGTEGERCIFQSVNDDSCIRATYQSLLTVPGYSIQY